MDTHHKVNMDTLSIFMENYNFL